MALGGGTWTFQNKALPGSYINFVSAARASAELSERGYAAMALELDWGPDEEIFTVETGDFQKNSRQIFGYDYSDDNLKGLRDLFLGIRTGYFYRLNSGGTKATNAYATAKYAGIRGNALVTVVENGEETGTYDVSTMFDGLKVETQTVTTAAELADNDYVTFSPAAELTLTAGAPLSGGTNGTTTNAAYQEFLDRVEGYSFNVLGCLSDDSTVKGLYANFTRRMRDDAGVKFQCVLHDYSSADYEGVISVENNDTAELVYWVTGAEAGCAVNASNTNKVYDGEYEVDTNHTQTQLEAAMKNGKFVFHRVSDKVRVLEDINTFVSFTTDKSSDFANNQTIRVLDQIGNDIAATFNTRYLGQVPNDDAGRISLWNDIVKHHQELERIRAIENFDPDLLTVEQGDGKRAVVVTDHVTPTNVMSVLYMTVVVA